MRSSSARAFRKFESSSVFMMVVNDDDFPALIERFSARLFPLFQFNFESLVNDFKTRMILKS